MQYIYIFLAVIFLLFWVLMLMDALKLDDQKGLWMAVIVVPLLIAIALYFLAGYVVVPLTLMSLGAFAYNFIKRGK